MQFQFERSFVFQFFSSRFPQLHLNRLDTKSEAVNYKYAPANRVPACYLVVSIDMQLVHRPEYAPTRARTEKHKYPACNHSDTLTAQVCFKVWSIVPAPASQNTLQQSAHTHTVKTACGYADLETFARAYAHLCLVLPRLHWGQASVFCVHHYHSCGDRFHPICLSFPARLRLGDLLCGKAQHCWSCFFALPQGGNGTSVKIDGLFHSPSGACFPACV